MKSTRIGAIARVVLVAVLAASASAAHAQDAPPLPPADVPDGVAPADPMALTPLDGAVTAPGFVVINPDPAAPPAGGGSGGATRTPDPGTAVAAPSGNLTLDAKLTPDGRPIPSDVVWRVFSELPGSDGRVALVKEETGGTVTLSLDPGNYVVHAAYGRAGATKSVRIGDTAAHDTLVLNAGGMRLSAMVGTDRAITGDDVSFDIYAEEEDDSGERRLIVPHARADKVVRLNAGTYHVVARYGDANAVVRADIRVEPGKLTEATLYHQAARITLKLVAEKGGEALANTNWSVVTPGGDTVFDSVGAFPTVVLAVGDYTAIAKHEDKIYERSFAVEAGLNREIEVLAD